MNYIYAKTVYTGKLVIENAYLLFTGQKIADVSKTKQGKPLGEFAVLIPAFIDPHSHIGMARAGEPSEESEANDKVWSNGVGARHETKERHGCQAYTVDRYVKGDARAEIA